MPVFAEKEHEHGDSKGPVKDGMMMGHEQMMAMHEDMQKMKEMMAKIKAETDPEKHPAINTKSRWIVCSLCLPGK